MKALILAAGKGTRLRPITDYIPKPMVPLQGKPLLEWVILQLISIGIKEFVVAISYLGEQIQNYFGHGERWGVEISYSYGLSPAGKAGEIWRARSMINAKSDPFLVVPGDTICHLDYNEFLRFHHAHKAQVSVALSTKYRLEVGIAEIDDKQRVTRFLEKSNLNYPISTGAYILDERIFGYIQKFNPEKNEVDLPKDVFPVLLSEGVPIYGMVQDYNWWDIGRLNDYENLVKMSSEEMNKILPWKSCDKVI